MRVAKDLAGKRFGRLVVIKRGGSMFNCAAWFCQCDCGTMKLLPSHSLLNGLTRSCGCLRREMKNPSETHGLSHDYRYFAWNGMIGRTTNPKNKSYKSYGGRGITVCDRWRNSFEAFFEDMGPRPSPKHSIDRIDNDGPYSPENCRWADIKTQHRNTSKNRFFTFNGKTKCLSEWAEITGIKSSTLSARILRQGWTLEKALTTPLRKQHDDQSGDPEC